MVYFKVITLIKVPRRGIRSILIATLDFADVIKCNARMITHRQNLRQLATRTFAVCALFAFSINGFAWSPGGHSAIGMLAMKQLQPEVYDELQRIVGALDEEAIVKACNWPDDIRETETWKWSAPQHYINIPRGENDYQRARDCADGMCATEAIKNYAPQIFDDALTSEKRWQAFAWLCHVTGDLHQPMHAAFADDRGGNNYTVIFKGREMNLHRFWDHELIDEFSGDWRVLVALLSTTPLKPAASNWSVESVDQWTAESHRLAVEKAYPPDQNIEEDFALQSWVLAQQQIRLAAYRLALIINSAFEQQEK